MLTTTSVLQTTFASSKFSDKAKKKQKDCKSKILDSRKKSLGKVGTQVKHLLKEEVKASKTLLDFHEGVFKDFKEEFLKDEEEDFGIVQVEPVNLDEDDFFEK